ncbi:MAG: cytochrome c [Proteobacteria bacterium]|nr:cytochrome c [Pseudomonadota bacterium]
MTFLRGLLVGLTLLAAVGCNSRAEPTPAGQLLYERHCASCHGADGRGDGPVAVGLTTRPSDLTSIALRNGGKFDDSAVLRTIDGQRAVHAHGPRDMPVWGTVFAEELEGQRNAGYTVLLHGRSLTDYVRLTRPTVSLDTRLGAVPP